MNMLKAISKVLRIQIFVAGLGAVFMLINILEVKLLSCVGVLLLVGSLIFFLLIDMWMIHSRKELPLRESLLLSCIFFALGIFLIRTPLEILQQTSLDAFYIGSLLLGITLLITNSFLVVVLLIIIQRKKS